MKNIVQYLLILCLLLFIYACKKESGLASNEYKILSGACGTIELNGKIGDNFNAAKDSLIQIREPSLTGGCPEDPCYNYYLETDTFRIDFDADNRTFLGITFKNSENNLSIFSMSDVLDSQGNHYNLNWCVD
jgi:hypothetical protein